MPIDLAKQRLAKIEANPPKPGADETAFLEDKRKVPSLHGAKCMQMSAQVAIIVQWVQHCVHVMRMRLCVHVHVCARECSCSCACVHVHVHGMRASQGFVDRLEKKTNLKFIALTL